MRLQLTLKARLPVPQLLTVLVLLSVLSMVTWKRKVQIQNGQARITLPKRWVEDQNIEDKDVVSIRDMKRDSALKLSL